MASKDFNELTEYFKSLKFKKKLINGLDETDVWKKIDELQTEFRSAYEAQRERYKALLQEREDIIRRLNKERGKE